MVILFNKIKGKFLYLVRINGVLRDLDGFPFFNPSIGVVRDVNGVLYNIDQNKIPITNNYSGVFPLTFPITLE